MKFFLILFAAFLIFGLYQRIAGSKGYDANLAKGEAFLAENKNKAGVTTTASGLQYETLEQGTGTTHPGPRDAVKVHYHGTLLDGTVFDSSVQRNEPITFGLHQVIAGWTEGVQTMVVGEKKRFYIPAPLGYGKRSVGRIPAGALLIFDVELLEIVGKD
ncbi:putative FKBP-type peptidyl-prolyl cis-trans isomerase FkpA [Vibrio stylophorae]|uniref:Peptidyl-prolyl cis-trans isomerase n=1 Tax=Vibrio stylophorae TaxID=659351 RepID=A0ABN8DTL4_9VIBR|nr:putative FKBP-type peptidyl-prolyl cis-trans isomerase FkpA [Vibrio stylophorae]